jgi:hypothetical protein
MPTIGTLTKVGAFEADSLNSLNTSLANINAVLGAATTAAPTGTGSVVLSTSPTLVTPALGTPSALVLTNATGLPGTSLTAGSVTSAQLDPQTIQYVTVNPTLAAFNAMYTTGIPLVAAQGAGTYIECLSILINLVYGSAAFTGGAAVGAYIGTTAGGTLVTGTLAATIFTTFSANKITTAYSAALGSTATASGILNTGLVLSCPTQVFAAGTGATISIKCAYRVHNTLA